MELKPEPPRPVMRKWALAFALVALAIVGVFSEALIFPRSAILRAVVRGQADEILKQNKDLLDEVGKLLASGKPADYKRIF